MSEFSRRFRNSATTKAMASVVAAAQSISRHGAEARSISGEVRQRPKSIGAVVGQCKILHGAADASEPNQLLVKSQCRQSDKHKVEEKGW